MTEQEAKTKWCPHAIASHTNPRQRLTPDDWLHSCIGSACMAWRWFPDAYEYTSLPVGINAPEGWEVDGPPRGEGGAVTHRQGWRKLKDRLGYCGLAGKP